MLGIAALWCGVAGFFVANYCHVTRKQQIAGSYRQILYLLGMFVCCLPIWFALVHVQSDYLASGSQMLANAVFCLAITAGIFHGKRNRLFWFSIAFGIWIYLFFCLFAWWPRYLSPIDYLLKYYPGNSRAGVTAQALYAIMLSLFLATLLAAVKLVVEKTRSCDNNAMNRSRA